VKILLPAAAVAAVAGAAVLWIAWPKPDLPPLVSEAYVWQRRWGSEVPEAIRRAAPSLGRIVVLAAELSFEGGKRRVVRVAIDHEVLRASGRPVGLALRVGPCPGPFDRGDDLSRFLAELAADLVSSARRKGLEPSEIEIDFDSAASKLDGYREWIEAIRPAVAPAPLAITALPSWLDRPAFVPLAAAAGRFVLQVHSLERPSGPDRPIVLCDPSAARRWVRRAGGLGIPFRVALPTYGYLVAFSGGGDFLGICAEGPRPAWPEDAVLKEVLADPEALAGLVREWGAERPSSLEGVIWYRLPVETDSLNWRWPTLAAVLRGRAPLPGLRAEASRTEPRLFEVSLRNAGEADARRGSSVRVRWKGAHLVGGDSFEGIDWIEVGPGEVMLRDGGDRPGGRIPPGGMRPLGWLRLSEEVEVDVRIVETS
jgi:hypothetical protein